MKKCRLFANCVGALLFASVQAGYAGPVVFAELDFFAADTTQITGDIDGNDFTWSLTNQGSDDLTFIRSIPGNHTIFDNTSNIFSSANYTPPTTDIDSLSFLFALQQDSGQFEVNFANPVTNPTFHFRNLDRLLWDFSPTTTTLSLLSGNSEISVQNGIVRDGTPATSGGQNSADGSVLLLGTFSSIVGTFGHNPGSNGSNDSGVLQISFDAGEQAVPVPAPSTVFLMVGGMLGLFVGFKKIEQGNRRTRS